ncbi:MAG: HAD family hydrolase [Planctomycetota bacterium]
MSFKAVIFDLDGTITQPYFDFDAIREEIGLARDSGPLLETMEKMTPQQRTEAERILRYHEERAVTESQLNPGAERTLSALRATGIRIGILTRNERDNAFAIAQKHNLQFDAVIGREDGPVKPDARLFWWAIICSICSVPRRQARRRCFWRAIIRPRSLSSMRIFVSRTSARYLRLLQTAIAHSS